MLNCINEDANNKKRPSYTADPISIQNGKLRFGPITCASKVNEIIR